MEFTKAQYGWNANDESGIMYRDEPPTKVEAIRAGAVGVNVHVGTEQIELPRLEHVRTVRCVDHRFSSPVLYTIYLHKSEYARHGSDVVVARRAGGSQEYYLINALDARDLYLLLAETLPEGLLWTLLDSLTDSIYAARVQGKSEVIRAFAEGRLVFEGRGSKRRAVLNPR